MFIISDQPIDIDTYKKILQLPQSGGFCSFEGWVRNHNNKGKVSRLEFSAYEQMAVNVGQQIIAQAKEKFDIEEAICIHRIGRLQIGTLIVWIGVSAKHREASFDACRYIIDALKADMPIWKKEFYFDRDTHEWMSNKENRP